ncbi:restriction endonuclease subunit S [Mycobacteroides abscessus subsp. abscessus]|uniref:restriction endonuclease subunit S n=1 Tax=Mycobacteroides abscessus TaxID=36809 RepID=UPI0009D080F3|nr:restriction endonuclease subunit S [Mycobacteroides abscessus]QSM92978.1 restriction endonuclease subunit S [Mycobacteroides abscessus subsp. abscessus]QSM98016.1 restriction endonuclease subunit S [Mycobacteroides abscessus subsp. abscessus]SLI41074.1 Restriction enzyme BgcI subunit beta [Mycobacteroides abscessus subsp. abscessus]
MTTLGDLFEVSYGQSLELNRLEQVEEPEGVNFISRTAKNNGVSARVVVPNGVEPSPAGVLTVALGGSVLSTFLQSEPFVCGRDVAVLTPKQDMTTQEKLWWAMCINANAFRYTFGRQANRTLRSLELPDTVPAWVWKTTPESVIEVHDRESERQAVSAAEPIALPDISTWGTFRLDDLFEIEKGGKETPGDAQVPYVTSSAFNNGVSDHRKYVAVHPAGTITVACDGSVGSAFYHHAPYASSCHVNVLTPPEPLTPEAALFVCSVIRMERFRYGFGRMWKLEQMKRTVIKLPVTPEGTPDWELMARYVRGLPYSAVFASGDSEEAA